MPQATPQRAPEPLPGLPYEPGEEDATLAATEEELAHSMSGGPSPNSGAPAPTSPASSLPSSASKVADKEVLCLDVKLVYRYILYSDG